MGNSDGFPILSDYAAALEHYEGVVPYKRGRNKGLRPLGSNRRYDRSMIRKDDQTGDIVCSYSGTDVIRFEQSGSVIVRHGGWESISTMDCLNHVLHERLRRFGNTTKWAGFFRVKGKMYLSDGQGMDHRFNDVLYLLPNGDIEGGATESQMVLDKGIMTKLRKHYAEFTEYLSYYAQMQPEVKAAYIPDGERKRVPKLPVTMSELRWSYRDVVNDRAEFFDHLHESMTRTTSDDRYAGFIDLAEVIYFNSANKRYDFNVQSYVYSSEPTQMREYFYELCRYYYSESLFTRQPVEKGKVVRDEAAKYIKYGNAEALPEAV
jgi:hypothetical protein